MRTDEEITDMIHDAQIVMNQWKSQMIFLRESYGNNVWRVKEFKDAVRNYNAMRGVIKALHYSLGSRESPLA
tara:strand:+ start:447 stop:662 length:216 start_codon:yes stop_codon:yes gene_type:complete